MYCYDPILQLGSVNPSTDETAISVSFLSVVCQMLMHSIDSCDEIYGVEIFSN